ncbi:MAG: class I SAM-dependent methyltransferase [Crenarchaeota archaeon]|nr:class I SAM-dependent methyltransferase [Thermoproteota archaeon]
MYNEIINRNIMQFIEKIKDKQIILFGAASRGKRVLNNLLERGIEKNKIFFCDNNPEKWNKTIFEIKILPLSDLEKMPKDTCIIISSSMYEPITKQLKESGFTNVNYYHSLLFAERIFEKYDKDFLRISSELKDCYLDSEERYTIYSSIKMLSKTPGDIAEVGVYRGGSAKLICEIKGNKNLYLFDTFEGLPNTGKDDLVKKGWLAETSLEKVKEYLNDYPSVHFFKGLFPGTAESISNCKFSFVHLDTDTYQSTLDGLMFFWPRMVSDGRIVSHDYNASDVSGIKKAFTEFFKDQKEKIIEIADTRVMIIK